MSDHEFEKQVQRKLDELKLRPSNAVWTAIEQDIRQHKPRRRFGFWMPLGVVALAVTGYLFYANQVPKREELAQAKTIHVDHLNNTDSEKTSTRNSSGSKDLAVYNENSELSPDANEGAFVNREVSGNPTANNNTNAEPRTSTTPVNSTKESAPEVTNRSANNATANTYNPSSTNTIATNKKANYKTATNKTATNRPAPLYTKTGKGQYRNQTPLSLGQHIVTNNTASIPYEANLSASTPQTVANTTETIATEKAITDSLRKTMQLSPASTAQAAPIQKQQPPKWRFGLMGSAGISRITQSNLFQLNGWLGSGALSQEKNKAEDLAQGSSFSAPNGPQASNNGLINTAPPPRRQAAAITQGFSWSAGVFAQRPLSRRLRLSIGLQYSYRSAHTTIGKLVNQPVVVSQAYTSGTVVNRYYTSLDALQMGNGLSTNSQFNLATIPRDSLLGRDYTYRFHAIEIPVTINWQINKGRQLPPFVLDAGLSIGKLLTTDALHYDGRGDIYYKDNSLLTKTQVNALMGLNVGLFQQSRLPIWVGPHLRYSLTGLVKKDVSNGQYLWATGIQVRMLLNPPKK